MPYSAASLPLFDALPAEQPPDPHVPAGGRRSLWTCLHFRYLPLEIHRARPLDEVVVFEAGRVLLAGDGARAAGVRAGLALNAALALHPGLHARERCRSREALTLERLAGWAWAYSSRVSMEPPDALLLEVGGSLRLFGGLSGLSQRLAGDLRRMGYTAGSATAPTPTAALWLARSGAESVTDSSRLVSHLGPLPLACTRWSDRTLDTLRGMGVTRLAECLRLPRDGFARRFGRTRLEDLDRATGRGADPRHGFQPPERFRAMVDLDAETRDIGRLLEAATAMLGELEVFLRARQAGISGLCIRFRHLGQAATRIRLRLVRPSRQARHIRELLASRLERLRLAAPVIGLDLDSSRIEPLSNQNASLLRSGPAGSEGPSLQLVERLRARLGEEAVHALCLLSEHRPESAWRVAEPGQPSERLGMPPRPFWLLEAPVRLADRSGVPLARGRLVPESGPERIETGWWDGHDVAREYYVARDAAGVRLWIYRDTRGDRAWYLHGIFG